MIGRRVRDLDIEQVDGSRARVTGDDTSTTLLFVRHPACDACDDLRRVGDAREPRLDWWGARLLVTDGDQRLRSTFELADDEAAVIVLDRFATVWERHPAPRGEHAPLPDADGLEESAKHLGTQCPECGVPDDPYTGRWNVL